MLLILFAVIYSHFRNFFKRYFLEILIIFFVILISFYIIEHSTFFNTGECNNKFFLIYYFNQFLSKKLTNSIFVENSHLAMTIIPALIATFTFLTKSKRINSSIINLKNTKILVIFLVLIGIIITILNFSTTFFVTYSLSVVFLFIFLFKKLSFKFWLIIFSFLIINLVIFFR